MIDPSWNRVKRVLAESAELTPEAQEQRLQEFAQEFPQEAAEARELLQAWNPELESSEFLEPPVLEDFLAELADPLLGRSFSDFEIIDELGRGSAGVVYRARQDSLERDVALKVLIARPSDSEGELRRFIREARVVASLDHPGIVKVHAVGVEDGVAFMAMELAVGGTLAESMHGQPIDPKQACDWVRQAAEAMHVAHQAGLVHRDLKPGNLLRAADGRVLVADFGLARSLEAGWQTTEMNPAGTPRYMSPEQLNPNLQDAVDARTDVYSLGVVLFELLAGSPPFDAGSLIGLFEQVNQVDPFLDLARLAHIPEPLVAICARAMEKDPSDRYASAAALAADLDRFHAGEKVDAQLAPRWLRLLRARSRRWWRRTAAGLTIAAAVWAIAALTDSVPEPLDSVAVSWPGGAGLSLAAWVNQADAFPGPPQLIRGGAGTVKQLAPASYRFVVQGSSGFQEWDRLRGERLDLTELKLAPAQPPLADGMLRIAADAEGPGFDLDARLVRNVEYLAFLAEMSTRLDHASFARLWPIVWDLPTQVGWWHAPVIGVRPSAARAYAEWRGKRLPTALEWKRAFRVPFAALPAAFSSAWTEASRDWSHEYKLATSAELGLAACRKGVRALQLLAEQHDQASPFLTGLLEWTSTLDFEGTGDRVLQGAAWHQAPLHAGAGNTQTHPLLPAASEVSATNIGFRCARSLRPLSSFSSSSP